jgi:hypothetical protein
MATITVKPLLFDLSLIHAKSKITGIVSKLPIAASEFASMWEKPNCTKMLGVYVVSGLHVEKTHPVAMKCGNLFVLVNVCHTKRGDM